jgi:hypothetical protein
VRKPEQSICCGDDVLDLGAGACFEHSQRVDENRLVGNQLASLFQLRQRGTRADEAFMTGFVSSSTFGGSSGRALKGFSGENGALAGIVQRIDMLAKYVDALRFYRHIGKTCRWHRCGGHAEKACSFNVRATVK